MKIDVNKIDEGRFVIREENNEEYIDQLSQSLLADGQWNPIILRPKEGGRYEIVAGHYRFKAVKKKPNSRKLKHLFVTSPMKRPMFSLSKPISSG